MGTTGSNKIGKYFAYTLLVIYPLVFLPDYDLTIYMKQAVLYVALAIALLSGIVIAVRERKFFRTRMSMTDFFVLAWLLCSTYSCWYGRYRIHTFLGDYGRYMGLVGITATCGCYYVMSRHFVHHQSIVKGIVVSGILINLFAVIQDMGFDLFHMAYGFEYGSYFLTTFGSRNVYATYISIFFCFVLVFYLTSEDPYSKKVFYIYFLIMGMGVVACDCDSVYLALVVIYLVVIWEKSESALSMQKVLQTLLALCFGMDILYLIRRIIPWAPLALEGITHQLEQSFFMIIFTAMLCALYGWCCWCHHRQIWYPIRKVHRLLLVIIVIAVSAVLLLLLLVNLMEQPPVWLESILPYLRFDDSWGGNRGVIWKISITAWQRFRTFKKWIGYGPSSLYFAIMTRFSEEELSSMIHGNLVDAHCEMINMLVTGGILGMITYYPAILLTTYHSWKQRYNDGWFRIVAYVGIAYLAQSTVNNIHIYMTPIFFGILGIGEKIKNNL